MSIANRIGLRVAAAAVASGAIVAGGLAAAAGPAGASTAAAGRQTSTSYTFRTLDNARDLTFNQLLGINDHGLIAGDFGSGAQGHPNKGYLLSPRYTQATTATRTSRGRYRLRSPGSTTRASRSDSGPA